MGQIRKDKSGNVRARTVRQRVDDLNRRVGIVHNMNDPDLCNRFDYHATHAQLDEYEKWVEDAEKFYSQGFKTAAHFRTLGWGNKRSLEIDRDIKDELKKKKGIKTPKNPEIS